MIVVYEPLTWTERAKKDIKGITDLITVQNNLKFGALIKKLNVPHLVMLVPHQVRDKLRRASGSLVIGCCTLDSRLRGNDGSGSIA